MSITTYTNLQTSVSDWLQRADMASRIPDFVTMFEAVCNRRLRLREMETSVGITLGTPTYALLTETGDELVTEADPDIDLTAGAADLPTDYLTWRRVTWTGSPRTELEYVHPSILSAWYPTTPSGIPQHFTIEGSTLKVRPTDSASMIEFDYYQRIPDLATNSTNWLLTAHPDLYLSGTLYEAFSFIPELEKALLWKARRDELFEEIKLLDKATKGPSSIRVMGYTP